MRNSENKDRQTRVKRRNFIEDEEQINILLWRSTFVVIIYPRVVHVLLLWCQQDRKYFERRNPPNPLDQKCGSYIQNKIISGPALSCLHTIKILLQDQEEHGACAGQLQAQLQQVLQLPQLRQVSYFVLSVRVEPTWPQLGQNFLFLHLIPL